MVRLILGFIVAALWLPALAYLTSRTVVGSLAGLIALFTVSLTLVFAVPLYVWLRRRVTFWLCALAGLSVGAIGCVVDWLVTNTLAAINWSPLLLVIGLASGLLFWVVAIWGNNALPSGRRVA
jgi:hypothetical protein